MLNKPEPVAWQIQVEGEWHGCSKEHIEWVKKGLDPNPVVRALYTRPAPPAEMPDAEGFGKIAALLDAYTRFVESTDAEVAMPLKVGLLNEIRAYAAAQPKWQDIASAPKDGTEFLMRFIGRRTYWTGVTWRPEYACFVQLSDYSPVEIRSATHWQPLPTPPATREGGGT